MYVSVPEGDQLTGRRPGFMDLKASCADLSKYVCFVCGCALAARVLAPLRLDEELWWFYVLACGGVLFGPLVGVLPERWHGQATARQLAVARVVYLVLFLQQERHSDPNLHLTQPSVTLLS